MDAVTHSFDNLDDVDLESFTRPSLCLRASGALSAITSLALTAFECVKFQSWRHHPPVAIATSLGAGATAALSLECLLPKRALEITHQINAKNALPVLINLGLVYANLGKESWGEQFLRLVLGTFGGAWLVFQVSMIARKKIAFQLLPTHASKKEVTVYLEPKKLNPFLISEALKLSLGAACVLFQKFYVGTPLFVRDIGYILIGRRGGRSMAKAFHLMIESLDKKHPQSRRLRILRGVDEFVSALSDNAWGGLLLVDDPLTLMGVGFLTGASKEKALNHFRAHPLNPEDPSWKSASKIQLGVDRVFGSGLAGFCLVVGGIEFSNRAFASGSALLSCIVGGTIGAYTTSKVNALFNPNTSSILTTTLKFYLTEYPVLQALAPLYVIVREEEINDIALEAASTLKQGVGVGTWFVYAFMVGNGLALPLPIKNFPPAASALMGQFIVKWAQGKK